MTQCKSNGNDRQAPMQLELGLGKLVEAKFDGGLHFNGWRSFAASQS